MRAFVSAAAYDLALSQLGEARERENDLRRANADLVARLCMLKLQGFAEQNAAPAMQVIPNRDPVALAINQACGGKDVRVRRDMLAQVARDRTAKVPEEEIARRILSGNRPGDEFTESTPSTTPNPGAIASAS